jgi:Kef-type K+ transport system membrane component KefB
LEKGLYRCIREKKDMNGEELGVLLVVGVIALIVLAILLTLPVTISVAGFSIVLPLGALIAAIIIGLLLLVLAVRR